MDPIDDLGRLIKDMNPMLNPGRFVFVCLPGDANLDLDIAIAAMRESEGLSVVLREEDAQHLGYEVNFVAAWITLAVHSDLAAIGLTAAVSNALTKRGVSCNVIAGFHHDHLFVPIEKSQVAMTALQDLQRCSGLTE